MPRRQQLLQAKNKGFSKVPMIGPRKSRYPLILIKKIGAKSLSNAMVVAKNFVGSLF